MHTLPNRRLVVERPIHRLAVKKFPKCRGYRSTTSIQVRPSTGRVCGVRYLQTDSVPCVSVSLQFSYELYGNKGIAREKLTGTEVNWAAATSPNKEACQEDRYAPL